MPRIAINFHGLCALAKLQGRADALLPPEGGAHKPVLTIPVSSYSIANSYEPTLVGHNGLEEIAMWDLKGLTLNVGSGASDAVWTNLQAGFALGLYHPGSRPRVESELHEIALGAAVGGTRVGAIVKLKSGTLSFVQPPSLAVRLFKNGQQILESRFPSAIQWEGETDLLVTLTDAAGADVGEIELDPQMKSIPTLSVTNVARVPAPDGIRHFSEYYRLLELANTDYPLNVQENERDITVYDCVPPVALPWF